jgi:hypothetical protein
MTNFVDVLPAEVRNRLYKQLMTEENTSSNALALFTVSKQVHQEASSFYYQNNAVTINTPSTSTGAATILPPVADRYLRYLKRFTLHALAGQSNMPRTRKVAAAIASLSCIGAQFSELSIVVTSSLSQVLNARVDDSVLEDNHPITEAIRIVLRARVAKTFRLYMQNTWFAPGVARNLQTTFGSQVEFYERETRCHDMSSLERSLIGRYSSMHLTSLGLGDENTTATNYDNSSTSTPSSLRSSLGSAFSELDSFTVTSWESGLDEAEAKAGGDSSMDDDDAGEPSFFTDDDLEDWSASTTTGHDDDDHDEVLGDLDDLDEDEEMEDVSQEDILDVMNNLQEIANHQANEEDIEYMVNFAPHFLGRF